MQLYTIQDQLVYNTLIADGIVYPNDIIFNHSLIPAYDWMVNQMENKIDCRDKQSKYPFWAFLDYAAFDTENNPDSYILTLNIEDSRVLLSDFYFWHRILLSSLDHDFLRLPYSEFEHKKSWRRCFYKYENSVEQACFWNITTEMVVSSIKVRDSDLYIPRRKKK